MVGNSPSSPFATQSMPLSNLPILAKVTKNNTFPPLHEAVAAREAICRQFHRRPAVIRRISRANNQEKKDKFLSLYFIDGEGIS